MLKFINNTDAELTDYSMEFAIKNEEDIDFFGSGIYKGEEIEIVINSSFELAKLFLETEEHGKQFFEEFIDEDVENYSTLDEPVIFKTEQFGDIKMSDDFSVPSLSIESLTDGKYDALTFDHVKFLVNGLKFDVENGIIALNANFDFSNDKFYLSESDVIRQCAFNFKVKSIELI